MAKLLSDMRADAAQAAPEPLALRRDRLSRAIALLVDHADAWTDALVADFGVRSRSLSLMTDVLPSVGALKHARKQLTRWARVRRRPTMFPLGLLGARAEVRMMPKGVVGVLAPWNFPLTLIWSPMAGILAAGNRALIKPSELTPRTSALLAELAPRFFALTELAVVTGDAAVAQAFSALPFDHLLFTGSTDVGRHVMRAAADNLVPVTLELGGKSRVIISRSADLAQAADRIALGKLMNAGQICLAPDYLLVPRGSEPATITALSAAVAQQYPALASNDDYAAIISDRHHGRLLALIEDARAKGATVTVVNPANEDFARANARKLPLHILTGVTDAMGVMHEELFGPILPILPYDSIGEAIAFVNARPRPLALYWFGRDAAERETVLARTVSGGVTINDVIFHTAMEELPFGGIGPSGMGAYHGEAGFAEFSHARAVYHQARFDVAKLGGLKPPYGAAAARAIKLRLKR